MDRHEDTRARAQTLTHHKRVCVCVCRAIAVFLQPDHKVFFLAKKEPKTKPTPMTLGTFQLDQRRGKNVCKLLAPLIATDADQRQPSHF